MDEANAIVVHGGAAPAEAVRAAVPALVGRAGKAAEFAWDEFFKAQIANGHTRRNYLHAVRRFLAWCDGRAGLAALTPGDVGEYFAGLDLATPTKKLHLAAVRRFFDVLVVRHVVVINPAASVKAERYAVVEGKTPEIAVEQTRRLLSSIDVADVVGLRDRAVLAVLVYTAARVGAVAKLTAADLVHDGSQYALRFLEKGGKSRQIPLRHDLERIVLDYLRAAGIADGPIFRTANRSTKTLNRNAMTGIDVCRMMKRRLRAAGLPDRFSPHSFRVAAVTDLLSQNVPLEDIQHLAGHADPRTTRLYDRRSSRIARNLVERISV
jgi:integrase/recombinase XerD